MEWCADSGRRAVRRNGGLNRGNRCYVGVPTPPPHSYRGEDGLRCEVNREAYSAPGACNLRRLSGCCHWFCWSAAGLVVCRCRVEFHPVSKRADRSLDTVTCWPRMTFLNVLSVRASVWWLQGAAYDVLPQEYVGRFRQILVDEFGRGCMACCRGWSQPVYVAAELLYEDGWLPTFAAATRQSNVDSITKNNLDWRRSVRTKFGCGVSFSPSATYAHTWCNRSAGYCRALIVARVLVGSSHDGDYDTKLPRLGYDTNSWKS